MNDTYNIMLLENIIVNIATDKYNKKIKCYCEEEFNNTIIVSIDEIKNNILNLDWIDLKYVDIEYLFYETYKIKNMWSYLCCGFYGLKYDIKIMKYLKNRIKYHYFSRYFRKSKKVYTSTDDSGNLLIVFELK